MTDGRLDGFWEKYRRKSGMAMAALALAGCAYPYTPPALPSAAAPAAVASTELRAPVTILISIDGFRPDYLDRGVTPVLSRLAAQGVRASMLPSFPSKTFPNHWTLVTGLVPDHHGIVANSMEDTRRPNETFTMATDDPFWWNDAEPIWVAAERAGVRTGTMFWPGSNVAWGAVRATEWPNDLTGGTRPQDWAQFAKDLTGEQRVRGVIDWLRRPAATRPRFVTLYFDTVDTAGHRYGPDDARTTVAVGEIDATIGGLIAGMQSLGQQANLVIVADHGMAATSSARTIALDKIADPADYRAFETGPYASLYPQPGREAALAAALLRARPHMQCWRKTAIPARLRYGTNPRIPPFFCLAEVGWLVVKTAPTKAETGGNHGYDNAAPAMRALFIADGPAFRPGQRLADLPNVDVYPLLRRLIGLPPAAAIDGSAARFKPALREK